MTNRSKTEGHQQVPLGKTYENLALVGC